MPRTLRSPVKLPWKLMGTSAGLALAALALASCSMQPDVAMAVTTADGVRLEVPLSAMPPPVADGVVSVNAIQFAPWDLDAQNKAKTVAFSFVIGFKPGAEPTRIVIEDDTEQPILEIFHTDTPKTGLQHSKDPLKDSLWGGVSKPFAPSDEHVNWILNLDNNIRVYRVTVVLKDGTTHVLLKPVFVPANMKTFMRTRLELS
jgi:hypothetical protein